MHGDNLAGFHPEKVFQQLVTEVGSGDSEKTHGTVHPADLAGAGVERKGAGGDEVFRRQTRLGQVLPVESEFGFTAHVEQIVHQPQPLPAVQNTGRRAQTPEIVEDIVLQMVQAGLGLPHGYRLDAKGDELGLGQAVVALGQLLFQHLTVLGPDVIEAVLLRRDADAMLKTLCIGGHVHKGELKVYRAVKEVQEGAPFLENGGLVLLQRQLVIDILELDCLCSSYWSLGLV